MGHTPPPIPSPVIHTPPPSLFRILHLPHYPSRKNRCPQEHFFLPFTMMICPANRWPQGHFFLPFTFVFVLVNNHHERVSKTQKIAFSAASGFYLTTCPFPLFLPKYSL
ncbi:hypothetical protein L6452_00809 [Arctium lappa]|uniref:Uncharacterized protein n=1 Tax=Arctium lappa TaxID=4217 RepID=A0ACB9FFX2_ARCLA|nr:hypothetical protein L6452_00809 [Arctium lappa]